MCTCKKSWPERVTGSLTKSRPLQPLLRVGIGRGKSRLAGGRWSALTRWQMGQDLMYSSTVAGRPGHQTERRANASILSRQKRPPSGEA